LHLPCTPELLATRHPITTRHPAHTDLQEVPVREALVQCQEASHFLTPVATTVATTTGSSSWTRHTRQGKLAGGCATLLLLLLLLAVVWHHGSKLAVQVCRKPVVWLQGLQQLLVGGTAQLTTLSLAGHSTAQHSMAQHVIIFQAGSTTT
jgi:hypothetical protein